MSERPEQARKTGLGRESEGRTGDARRFFDPGGGQRCPKSRQDRAGQVLRHDERMGDAARIRGDLQAERWRGMEAKPGGVGRGDDMREPGRHVGRS